MEIPLFSPIDQILFDKRMIQVSGAVDSRLAYRVNRQILAMNEQDSKKPIILFIDSPGGEIYSGFSIYDTARFVEAPVTTVVAGLAASMGSIIALCAEKKRRLALPNAKFLIHQPLLGGTMHGPASDLEIHAKDILKTRDKLNRLYAEETGMSFEKICQLTDRDRWLEPEEALEMGLISKIISSRKDIAG